MQCDPELHLPLLIEEGFCDRERSNPNSSKPPFSWDDSNFVLEDKEISLLKSGPTPFRFSKLEQGDIPEVKQRRFSELPAEYYQKLATNDKYLFPHQVMINSLTAPSSPLAVEHIVSVCPFRIHRSQFFM